MSKQEMNLDTAIQRFQLVDTFPEYEKGLLEVLTRVHSQEELDRARVVIDERKQYMIENNPEFNTVMENKKLEAKQRAELDRAVHKAKMAEAEAKSKSARADALDSGKGAMPDRGVDDWVAKTRFKTVNPEELEKKTKKALWCPICVKENKNRNIINNEPTCIVDMHRLVPKYELKNYPRSYRRAWKRGKKKK